MSPSTLTAAMVSAALRSHDEAEARQAGSRAMFDHIACLVAGRRSVPEGVGDGGAAAAADRDDLHWPSLTHPGAIIWSVLRSIGAEDATLWRAAHAGYEVTARLGKALGQEHRRYWHATTTAGTVGGAVAAAIALDSDPVNAAGHAISVTGGSIVCILQRSGTRILHRDHAVATALRCARCKLAATADGLEHPRGFFAAMGGSSEKLLEPARESALSEITFRRHATSGFCQAAVEAACELAPVEPGCTVHVEAPEATVALAGIADPKDAEEAWWSCQHAVAVSLLGLDLEDSSLVYNRRVADLRKRVHLTVGPRSWVSVEGRTAARTMAAPLTDEDLMAKWETLNPGVPAPLELLA